MTPAPSPHSLLTTEELAALLKIHAVTIRRDRASGNALGIPFIRIGRSVRYRLADLDVYFERNRSLA